LRRAMPSLQFWAACLVAGLGLFAAAETARAQDFSDGDAPPDLSLPSHDGPATDLDWSIGLRGAYVSDSLNGGKVEGIVAPNLSFTRNGARDTTSLSTGGEFSIDNSGQTQIQSLRLGGSSAYALDELSKLSGAVDLSLTQLDATDSSLPGNTAVGPTEFTGTAEGDATRRFGRFDVTGRLRGERFIEGPTTLDDHSVVDNTDQNYWRGTAGLRVGFELSPLLSVFADGSESYQKFDAASPGLGLFLDGRTTELRGGLSYSLPGTLSAEVSAGRAWLDYTNPALTDQPGWVVDGSLTLTPDETLSLTGTANTSIGPSTDTVGDTDVAYSFGGNASYLVNPWLKLRGSGSLDTTRTLGTGAVGWGWSAGAGLDLQTAKHVVWTADYLFEHSVPATTPASDTHTVTVGVTFKK
jgi:hypothetical protein